MSSLTINEQPETEPISLEEAQMHLRVDTVDDSSLISGYIKSAREYCERVQGRAYVTRTYELVTAAASEVELLMPPIDEVESVVARLSDGTQEEVEFEVDADVLPPVVTIESLPATAEKLIITYTAGYGEAADVPPVIKQAMLLLVGHWYEHRAAAEGGSRVEEVPFAVTNLLNLDRVNWGV